MLGWQLGCKLQISCVHAIFNASFMCSFTTAVPDTPSTKKCRTARHKWHPMGRRER